MALFNLLYLRNLSFERDRVQQARLSAKKVVHALKAKLWRYYATPNLAST